MTILFPPSSHEKIIHHPGGAQLRHLQKDTLRPGPATRTAVVSPSLSLTEVTDWYQHQPDSSTIRTNSLGQKRFNLKQLQPDLGQLTNGTTKKGNYWLIGLKGRPIYRGLELG